MQGDGTGAGGGSCRSAAGECAAVGAGGGPDGGRLYRQICAARGGARRPAGCALACQPLTCLAVVIPVVPRRIYCCMQRSSAKSGKPSQTRTAKHWRSCGPRTAGRLAACARTWQRRATCSRSSAARLLSWSGRRGVSADILLPALEPNTLSRNAVVPQHCLHARDSVQYAGAPLAGGGGRRAAAAGGGGARCSGAARGRGACASACAAGQCMGAVWSGPHIRISQAWELAVRGL